MIFLPNKIERYTAALRLYIQQSVLKNGIDKKYLESLKKIYIAEALLIEEDEQPISPEIFLNNMLCSVYILKIEKNMPFSFKINIRKAYLLKEKLFTALILSICKTGDFIEINSINGKIIIKSNAEKTNNCLRLIKKLKGSIFYEIKSGNSIIILPSALTDKKPVRAGETVEEYVLNPLSVVNFFI